MLETTELIRSYGQQCEQSSEAGYNYGGGESEIIGRRIF
jgi:hypothetical protein